MSSLSGMGHLLVETDSVVNHAMLVDRSTIIMSPEDERHLVDFVGRCNQTQLHKGAIASLENVSYFNNVVVQLDSCTSRGR